MKNIQRGSWGIALSMLVLIGFPGRAFPESDPPAQSTRVGRPKGLNSAAPAAQQQTPAQNTRVGRPAGLGPATQQQGPFAAPQSASMVAPSTNDIDIFIQGLQLIPKQDSSAASGPQYPQVSIVPYRDYEVVMTLGSRSCPGTTGPMKTKVEISSFFPTSAFSKSKVIKEVELTRDSTQTIRFPFTAKVPSNGHFSSRPVAPFSDCNGNNNSQPAYFSLPKSQAVPKPQAVPAIDFRIVDLQPKVKSLPMMFAGLVSLEDVSVIVANAQCSGSQFTGTVSAKLILDLVDGQNRKLLVSKTINMGPGQTEKHRFVLNKHVKRSSVVWASIVDIQPPLKDCSPSNQVRSVKLTK